MWRKVLYTQPTSGWPNALMASQAQITQILPSSFPQPRNKKEELNNAIICFLRMKSLLLTPSEVAHGVPDNAIKMLTEVLWYSKLSKRCCGVPVASFPGLSCFFFFALRFAFSIMHNGGRAWKWGKPGNTCHVNDVWWSWGSLVPRLLLYKEPGYEAKREVQYDTQRQRSAKNREGLICEWHLVDASCMQGAGAQLQLHVQ